MNMTANVNLDEKLNELFEKLLVQLTKNVYELHFMRESVEREEQFQREDQFRLHASERKCAEVARRESAAQADQDAARLDCEKQIEELMRETTQNCATTLEAEVNHRLVAAMTALVTQQEEEAASLRREEQSRQSQDRQGGVLVAGNVEADQIMWAAKEVATKVQNISVAMSQLESNHQDAQDLVHALFAYKEARRIDDLQVRFYLESLNAQIDKLGQHSISVHVGKRPVTQSSSDFAASFQEGSVHFSSIRKELEAERMRGAEFVKELCETTLKASAKATWRQNWLNEGVQRESFVNNDPTEE